MASPGPDPAVSCAGLSVFRGNRRVLEEVSFTLARGRIMGIIGPNGAGKTTLVNALCGFLPPASGSLQVLGRELKDLKPGELARLRSRIGLLPQLSEVNELAPLSVREVVAIARAAGAGPGRRLAPEDHEKVEAALETFGLSGLARKAYHQLSGGEQRKAHLARVFAQEPELLLLDEPISNLDVSWQERLREEIQRLWERTRIAVIMVTHETQHLPEGCSLLGLMREGRMIRVGEPGEILSPGVLAEAYGEEIKVLEHQGRTYLLGA